MCTKFSNAEWQRELSTLETKLLRNTVSLAGCPMEDVDKVRYVNCLLMYANVLRDCAEQLDSLELAGIGQQLCDTSIIKTVTSIAAFDADIIQDQLKALLLVIRKVSPQGMSLRSIKKLERSQGLTDDVEVRQAVAPFIYYERCVLRHAAGPDDRLRAKFFALVNQMLQFTVRLTLTRLPGLEEKHMDEYIQLENEMSSWTYDPLVIVKLRRIVEEWLEDLNLLDTSDSHGYGATRDVARSVGTYAKWLSMQANSGEQHREAAKLLLGVQHEAVERATNELSLWSCEEWSVPCHTDMYARYVRYMCVPKGLTKKRGVSMEDTVNQYYQKIIFDRLNRHFKKHPEIGVFLEKQEYSRWVAKVGSRSGVFGTFDLSSASDTVTWELVRLLFCNTKLWDVLNLTRTRYVEIEALNLRLPMNKAYGMGSACCFPVMSLILSAICELANREKGIRRLHVVYGDDMVVHQDVAERIAELLKLLHFKLNTDKSYLPGSCFTEACGGEYYLGHETEPIRISRSWDFASFTIHSPSFKKYLAHQYKGCLDTLRIKQAVGEAIRPYHDKEFTKLQMETIRELANTAFDAGLMNLRRYCIQITRRAFKDVFFSNDSRGFHSFNIENQTFETKFEPYWLDDESRSSVPVNTALRYRVKTLVTHTDRPVEGESLRLERWFETREVALRQVLHLADAEMRTHDPHLYELFLAVRAGDDPDGYYTFRFIERCDASLYQSLMRQLSQLSICPNVGSAGARYKWRWLPCTE